MVSLHYEQRDFRSYQASMGSPSLPGTRHQPYGQQQHQQHAADSAPVFSAEMRDRQAQARGKDPYHKSENSKDANYWGGGRHWIWRASASPCGLPAVPVRQIKPALGEGDGLGSWLKIGRMGSRLSSSARSSCGGNKVSSNACSFPEILGMKPVSGSDWTSEVSNSSIHHNSEGYAPNDENGLI
ncbi:hypothetical protein JX266_013973 [Neoarthrinium moseri]|nr:hypothetical protein JX266_013973 [Neoarthrinium moseri]